MTDRTLENLPEFVMGMLDKMDANGYKPGWRTERLSELYWALEDEVVDELRLDIDSYTIADHAVVRDGHVYDKQKREALERAIDECFDVGNFAFFIMDKCKLMLHEIEARERAANPADDVKAYVEQQRRDDAQGA